jgi:hypothetical protein
MIASIPDATVISKMLCVDDGNLYQGALFKIIANTPLANNRPESIVTGTPYRFTFDQVIECDEYIVRMEDLIVMARRVGLECVWQKNFLQFILEEQETRTHTVLANRMKVNLDAINKDQCEALSIFTMVCFRKVSNARQKVMMGRMYQSTSSSMMTTTVAATTTPTSTPLPSSLSVNNRYRRGHKVGNSPKTSTYQSPETCSGIPVPLSAVFPKLSHYKTRDHGRVLTGRRNWHRDKPVRLSTTTTTTSTEATKTTMTLTQQQQQQNERTDKNKVGWNKSQQYKSRVKPRRQLDGQWRQPISENTPSTKTTATTLTTLNLPSKDTVHQ